jgi:hypothetical protein
MDFKELGFRSKMLEQQRGEEVKNQLIAASFAIWQYIASQGGKTNWKKYLESLGLAEKAEPISEEARKVIANRSYSIAEKIRSQRAKNA